MHIIFILPFVVLLVLVNQIDDDLSPAALEFLERIDLDAKSPAHLYLLGIDAPPDVDPTLHGQQRLDAHTQQMPRPEYNALDLPERDMLCTIWDEGCPSSLLRSDQSIHDLIQQHQIALSRSEQFLRFDEYVTLTEPSVDEPIARYQYVLLSQKLNARHLLHKFQANPQHTTTAQIYTQITQVRHGLTLQDSLLGRIAMLRLTSELLDIYALMLHEHPTQAIALPALSPEERDYRQVFAREFYSLHHMLKSLDRHPDIASHEGNYPPWLSRFLFKPNISSNHQAEYFKKIELGYTQSPASFAQNHTSYQPVISKLYNPRNLIGDILLRLTSDYGVYIGRLNDLEAKIALFNQLYVENIAPEALTNPYGVAYGYSRTITGICFDGPLEDQTFTRCIPYKH